MNDVLSAFLLTFAGLFPIVNPFEAAPFFLGLTAGMSSAERRVLARKAAVNGFSLLLGSMVLGPFLLQFFGIELPVVRIAGGLVVTAEVGVDRHKISYFGDVLNATGRMEALCRTLEAPILISADLLSALPRLPEAVTTRPLGEHAVRGRGQPLSVFEIKVHQAT